MDVYSGEPSGGDKGLDAEDEGTTPIPERVYM